MELPDHPGVHLTYCSNIHPGETWAETRANVRDQITAVKARVAPEQPFGVGLRLSAAAAEELRQTAGELERFADELRQRGLYVFTINGFPYGRFHGTRVKEAVYRPDWREPARLRYTQTLAEILARLLPAGVEGSISTVPGGFGAELAAEAAREQVAQRLRHCAAGLWRRRQEGGPSIVLALEPEPACLLETTHDAVGFFERYLLGPAALAGMSARTGLSREQSEAAIRQHLGVCLDTCHAAVEFEEPGEALQRLQAAGIRIAKVQITAGLALDPVSPAAVEALAAYADPVYLHQVVAQTDEGRVDFLDLPQALAAYAEGRHRPRRWRVHFHVPVFQRELPPFSSTQDFLDPVLRGVLAGGLCRHLELETYTWSVLPKIHRAKSMIEAIEQELRWVLQRVHGGSHRGVPTS